MGQFPQFLIELTAREMIIVGYYRFTFLFSIGTNISKTGMSLDLLLKLFCSSRMALLALRRSLSKLLII